MRVKWAVAVVVLSLAASTPFAHANRPVLRVLFVGNSYTRHNDLPEMVARIGNSNGVLIRTQLAFMAGATLREQWRTRSVTRYLSESRFTHVVLQGHSMDALERPEELADYMARFKRAADAANAQTILYQTWARHPDSNVYREGGAQNPEEMQGRIDEVYARIGRQLGARVAPVGDAWQLALAERPSERLHWPDGSHPTRSGSYLAACVLFGALTGESPQQARYRPHFLERGQADWFRQVATRALHVDVAVPGLGPNHAPSAESQLARIDGQSEPVAAATTN